MDVSRIEAYNPKYYSWRDMTAKEILKYSKQGVEVPDIYVQWAQEFLKNISKYDNDEVTYEKAKAVERHASVSTKSNVHNNLLGGEEKIEESNKTADVKAKEKEPAVEEEKPEIIPNVSVSAEVSASGESGSSNDGTEALSTAKAKHKDMKDNGISLRKQALSFTNDSTQTAREAFISGILMKALEGESQNEIQELESAMQSILAEAEAKQGELSNEVATINNEKSNNLTFMKIEQLQRELEQSGRLAQIMLGQSSGSLSALGNEIGSQTDIILSAGDFGSETIDIGNELIASSQDAFFIKRLINTIIGKRAVSAGEGSVVSGEKAQGIQSAAMSVNTSAKSQINQFQNEVNAKTGVAAMSKKEQGSASEQDPITGKEKESDKDIKTAQNDGSDTTDKLNINIDEILKRKVRRGEVNMG